MTFLKTVTEPKDSDESFYLKSLMGRLYLHVTKGIFVSLQSGNMKEAQKLFQLIEGSLLVSPVISIQALMNK